MPSWPRCVSFFAISRPLNPSPPPQLLTTALRRDPASFLSMCPLDLLNFIVAPMVKNMSGFFLLPSASVPPPVDIASDNNDQVPQPAAPTPTDDESTKRGKKRNQEDLE